MESSDDRLSITALSGNAARSEFRAASRVNFAICMIEVRQGRSFPTRPAAGQVLVLDLEPDFTARCGLIERSAMPDLGFRFRRSWKAMHRRSREWMMIAKG